MYKSWIILLLFCVMNLTAQNNFLTKKPTVKEINQMDDYLSNLSILPDVITSPPNFNVRTMAEWEEIQSLTIAWEGFEPILTEIVRNSVNECKVFIACDNPSEVENYLDYYDVNTSNVEYLDVSTNSIWMRDYGQNTIYKDDVDSIYLVDWVYNRPRPQDDTYPEFLANYMGIDLYQTSQNPNLLVHTGGNFMSDGFGTAFSSNLVLEENDIDESSVDQIMNNFMGIDTYIKMETLPFDGIHHIDMHMKLLDEETLLVAEYPEGMSDGPQIEENLQYILDNFTTKWGTPFKVIRIPSPPSTSGYYPGEQPELNNAIDGYYRTYTNSVFVNNTVLVPFYREEYDTIAQRIYEEALPGYNIIGIDCDDNGNNIISQGGAIHCITHSVGVNDPLLISYKKIEDQCPADGPYVLFEALVKHRSGIANAYLYYRPYGIDSFSFVEMQNQGDGVWSAVINNLDPYSESIEYYVHAIANNGKQQYRPITALNGGVNTFAFSLDECDGDECNGDMIPGCSFMSVWDPVCGCNGVTYSNSGEAACNNIFYFTEGPCESSINLVSYLNNNKSILHIFDISGKKINQIQEEKIIIILYNDGTVEKKYIN